MKPLTSILFASTVLVLAIPTVVEAQLTWRVSVKVVLDENGMRAVDGVTFPGCCDLNTDAEIQAKIDTANDILVGNGPADVPQTEPRGYTLDLLEIIELSGLPAPPSTVRACHNDSRRYCSTADDCRTCVGGSDAGDFCDDDGDCDGGTCSGASTCDHVSHWFYAPVIRDVRNAIRDAATANPVLWGWDDSAINIYVLGSDGSGTAHDMILLGQDLASPNTPFHEVGHFFSLEHTHGGGGSSPDCDTGWDDGVSDTLEDNCGPAKDCGPCWDKDQIANWNFPTQCDNPPCDYDELTSHDQHRVDQVYYNLMCYRSRREVLTPGQLDRMTDHSNDVVHHVTDGRTRFVDLNGHPIVQNGSSTFPYTLVQNGLIAADSGDIVLIRAGSYDEVLEIDQDVVLRASQGDALIGDLP